MSAAQRARRMLGTARARWLLAALWVGVLWLAVEHRVLAVEAVPIWDARDLHAPNQILLADHARAGRLLWWNPWTQAGSPDFADPQTGSFSPISVALGAATGGSTAGFLLLWLGHWLLGGLGVLAVARRLEAPPWGGVLAALGWMLSGLYVGQAQHTPILISFSYLPLILWRVDVALRERRLLAAAQAGALWGLSGLYGYPAMTILNPIVAALWALGRQRAGLRSLFAAGAVFAATGGVVLAPAYFAIWRETPGYSDYTGAKSRETAISSDALEPGALATLASPYLATLKLANRNLWPKTDVTMASLYCGAAVVSLALFAALGARERRFRLGLVAAAALALGLAVGDALPLRGWLYDLFPPSRFFRHAALFRVYAMLALVLLAACGAADLARASRAGARGPWRRFAIVAAAAAIAAIAAYRWVDTRALAAGPSPSLARAHLLGVWLGIAAIAAAAPVLERRRRGLAAAALLLAAAADAALAQALARTTYVTQPELVLAWRLLGSQRSESLDLTRSGLARSFETQFGGAPSGMNVALKVATLRGYQSLSNRFFRHWLETPMLAAAALENAGGRPRTWFAPEAPEVPVSDAAWEAFARRAKALGAPPLVVHAPGAMLAAGRPSAAPDASSWWAAEPIEVRVTRYAPEELAFDVESPSAGWLLVTDRWSRSWRAAVNGREVPIYGGNFVFRALRIGAGASRVRFVYEPGSAYLVLVAISWSTLAAVAAASAGAALCATRRRGCAPRRPGPDRPGDG